MKKLFLLIFSCCYFLSSCENSSGDFDWLVGNWIRTNGKPTEQTYEQWQKRSAEKYEGLGFTLVKKDTVFKENLSLLKEEGKWNLVVEGVHEDVVKFLLINQTSKSFTVENRSNDFPKIISYELDDEILKATIADDENSIDFLFKKQ